MIVVVDVETDQDLGPMSEHRDSILGGLLLGVTQSFKVINQGAKVQILNVEGTILKGIPNEEADREGVTEDYAGNPS